jgi:hypothetical protein
MDYNPQTKHIFEFTPLEICLIDRAVTAMVDKEQELNDHYDCDGPLGTLQMEFEDLAQNLADMGEI